MKKSDNKKPQAPAPTGNELRWTPLFIAFRDASEWALDIAVALARGYPEEVEAVERVRAFLRARIVGEVADVHVDDVMFVFGLLLAAIERDLGPIGKRISCFAPPFEIRFPTSNEWEPRLPRRLHAQFRAPMPHADFIH